MAICSFSPVFYNTWPFCMWPRWVSRAPLKEPHRAFCASFLDRYFIPVKNSASHKSCARDSSLTTASACSWIIVEPVHCNLMETHAEQAHISSRETDSGAHPTGVEPAPIRCFKPGGSVPSRTTTRSFSSEEKGPCFPWLREACSHTCVSV